MSIDFEKRSAQFRQAVAFERPHLNRLKTARTAAIYLETVVIEASHVIFLPLSGPAQHPTIQK